MDDPDGYFGEPVAATYDDPTSREFDPAVVAATVDVLAGLAGAGRALEFAIGTGRIALPLAACGVPVHGIDMSRAMVARLRAKPGGDAIGVTFGDFATCAGSRPAGHGAVPDHPDPLGLRSLRRRTQAMSSNYVKVEDGRGEYRSIPFRYVWPSELDLMAQMAGLRLRDRWDGWTAKPFTSESTKHVSIWEKPTR